MGGGHGYGPQIQENPRVMEVEEYIILTDQQLVVLAREGDSDALEVLLDRYRGGLHRLCLSRTGGNADDADDLMQDTFIKVFMNLDKYDPSYTFGQWIYTIARNTFVDYMRRRRDDLIIELEPSAGRMAVNPPSSDASPEERVINTQRGAQLESYLEGMNERYRTLIRMRFFEERTYEEIASELAIPLGTVKTQIHRAREQLCRLLLAGGAAI